jgi:hypothetical protein
MQLCVDHKNKSDRIKVNIPIRVDYFRELPGKTGKSCMKIYFMQLFFSVVVDTIPKT